MSYFRIIAKYKNARAGVLKTAHGEVETPVFMPVGTQGTVKALDPKDLSISGVQILLGNTYHLYLRPGHKLIEKLGGLHKFMGWNGPILTDSGGFQAFSLGAMIEHGVRKVGSKGKILTSKGEEIGDNARLNSASGNSNNKAITLSKITDEGVHFVSHLDGSKHLLTPELSIQIQLSLGSDICLVLDELLSPLHSPQYVEKSLQRTHLWEQRSREYFRKNVQKSINLNAQLFGIVQGVYDKSIRENEAKWIAEQDFDGVSIGGSFGISEYYKGSLQNVILNGQSEDRSLSLSEENDTQTDVDWAASKAIYETMEWVVPILPENWPKHALGIGEVQDFFECIERGIDMFDCVAPTRRARNGSLYVSPENGGSMENKFTLSIAKSDFREDIKPINPGCECYTCQNFSRAYLRHLFLAKELLYYRLATIHNVYFMINLVKTIRKSIIEQTFDSLKKEWID